MEINDKFEWMSHGVTGHVGDDVYRTNSCENIKENKAVKDLGVMISGDISFAVQMSAPYINPRLLASKSTLGS